MHPLVHRWIRCERWYRRMTVKRLTIWSCSSLLSIMMIYNHLPQLAVSHSAIKFAQMKKNHRPKSLITNRLKRVAEMSDMKFFKDKLLKPMLKPRVSGSKANKEVQEHIIGTLTDLGWTVEQDPFTDSTPIGDVDFNNIIATHDVSAPRRLTLACHFDSKLFNDFEFVGATDSAVPCAMLLDLATNLNDALMDNKKKSGEISLQLLFFDGEEAFVQWRGNDNTYGARHLAAKMERTLHMVDREVEVKELEAMDVLILLDLIGYKNPVFRSFFPETDKLFKRLQNIESRLTKAGALSAPVTSASSQRYFKGELFRGGGIEDDHIPFLKRKVPILHLITYPFPDVWHKANDNAKNIDYTSVDDLNKIFRVFVCEYLHLSPAAGSATEK